MWFQFAGGRLAVSPDIVSAWPSAPTAPGASSSALTAPGGRPGTRRSRGRGRSRHVGRVVQAELRRRADRLVAGVSPDQPPHEQALVALADLRQAIDELDQIAGRLARSAVAHGAPWPDVASSLRLPPERAQRAYERS